MEINNAIIYLIGFAGTGKLTIAREIAEKTNFRVVANHLINNPILSLVPTDGKTPLPEIVWEKISNIRETVYDTITNISPPTYSFVFTNELVENVEVDEKIYRLVEKIAIKRNSIFMPVCLTCSPEELCRRVTSEDRKKNYKMTDAEISLQQSRRCKVLKPSYEHTQILDVTNLLPEQAADEILYRLKELVSNY